MRLPPRLDRYENSWLPKLIAHNITSVYEGLANATIGSFAICEVLSLITNLFYAVKIGDYFIIKKFFRVFKQKKPPC